MTKTVEFFFDFASATSYLAYTQLPKIAAARNAEIILRGAVAMQMRMPQEFQRFVDLMFRAIRESHRNFNQQDEIAAPTFFVAEQMFFGQDRLEFVAQALDREAA